MLRDAAVSLIAARMGQRTDLNAAILLEMALTIQTKLEETAMMTPWFLLYRDGTLLSVVGDDLVSLPSDFIVPAEDRALQVYDATALRWLTLEKMTYEDLDAKHVDAEPTQPTAYAIDGVSLVLRPVPDAAYSLRLRYFRHDPLTIATNIETNWLKYAPDLVIAATCAEVARGQIHDMPLAQSFSTEILGAWNRVKILNEARQHAGMRYEMGED
jgi:hypothetical protein